MPTLLRDIKERISLLHRIRGFLKSDPGHSLSSTDLFRMEIDLDNNLSIYNHAITNPDKLEEALIELELELQELEEEALQKKKQVLSKEEIDFLLEKKLSEEYFEKYMKQEEIPLKHIERNAKSFLFLFEGLLVNDIVFDLSEYTEDDIAIAELSLMRLAQTIEEQGLNYNFIAKVHNKTYHNLGGILVEGLPEKVENGEIKIDDYVTQKVDLVSTGHISSKRRI